MSDVTIGLVTTCVRTFFSNSVFSKEADAFILLLKWPTFIVSISLGVRTVCMSFFTDSRSWTKVLILGIVLLPVVTETSTKTVLNTRKP